MKRTGAHLIHELGMLAAICLAEVWRFTGLPLHEYLAAVLGAAVFAHLLMQRSWITANVRKLRALPGVRAKFNVALNAALFIAFVAAMVSGAAISKVLIPHPQQPAEFLRWHEVHDAASKLIVILAGLHLALNWSSIVKAASVFRRPRREAPANAANVFPSNAGRASAYGVLLLLSALAVAGAVYGLEKALPFEDFVTVITRDGRVERVRPPQDLVELREDQRTPSVRGVPKFLATLGLVAVTAVTGRKLLRVRL